MNKKVAEGYVFCDFLLFRVVYFTGGKANNINKKLFAEGIMSALTPMNRDSGKAETVNVTQFLRRKKKDVFPLAGYKKADDVFNAAKAAIKSLSHIKELPKGRGNDPYIYDFSEKYISNCRGRISEETLSIALSAEKGRFSSDEMNALCDILRLAAAVRICKLVSDPGKSDGELAELLLCDAKISQIDFSRLFFAYCGCCIVLSSDETYSVCSDETKRAYVRRIREKAAEWKTDEIGAAERCIGEAKASGKDLSLVLFEEDKKPAVCYFVSVFSLTLAMLGIYIFLCVGTPAVFLFPLLIAPAFELSKRFVSFFYLRRTADKLLSVSSGKALEETRCVVTVATLLYGEKRDCEVFDRLEDFYLRNKSKNYVFSVLGDLGESASREDEGDEKKIAYAAARITSLCEKYGGGFALFVRKRTYVKCQKKYMAWERKRGGVIELCRFISGENVDFLRVCGDAEAVRGCRYILTLDRDTELFYGSVRKLLGIMIHPFNHPVFDAEKGRITSGYGVIQPSVIPSLSSAYATTFAFLSGGEGGLDVYTGNGKELYQSIIGEGCFCGKGMIDVSAFLSTCEESVADERILSHDIIEGSLLRCGAATDVVLTDGTPSNALSYYTRLHRWIRGDLQSLPYLPATVQNRAGETIKNPVGAAGKYRIIENAIRHFAPFSALLALFLSLFSGEPAAYVTSLFAFAYLLYPFAESILAPILTGGIFRFGTLRGYLKDVLYAFERLLFSFMSFAQDAFVFADSAFRTVYRFSVSGEHFLDWKTAADGEGESSDILSHYGKMLVSTVIGLVSVVIFPGFLKILGVLWALFPAVSFFCSVTGGDKKRVSRRIRSKLKKLCEREWRFFADNVGEKTNYLPPDNYQFSPAERVAMRTSPTNIGLFLVSALAARDFGYIDSTSLSGYIGNAARSIEKLLKWHGNLYNWYDLQTLEVIGEPFISSVDNGNFAVCLVAVCEGIKEYACEEPSLLDALMRLENILSELDLMPLYDESKRLFYIGYNAGTGRYTDSRYDIFMSEARLLSYYAVATGQVPSEHYFAPERKVGARSGRRGLLSWSGTAFEYFMPSLFLPAERDSVVRYGLDFAYAMQKKAAVTRFFQGKYFSLWGISESQYFAFDGKMNYQYMAFGTETLSLDPEFEKNEVVSPYSVFLMMAENVGAAIGQLRQLRQLGAYGKYGFCEAVDLSPCRVGDGYAVMKSYMSHHKGMSLAAAANLCFGDVFVRRFLKSPSMRAGKILLSEKIPKRAPVSKPQRVKKRRTKPLPPDVGSVERRSYRHNVLYPDVCAVSNGKTRITASSSGHILLYDGDDCISYSDFDRFSLSGGLSVTAEVNGRLISAVPLGYTDKSLDSDFSFFCDGNVITYRSSHRGRKFSCDFSVSLTVSSEHSKFIISAKTSIPDAKIMLCFEPVMRDGKAYRAHKCFSGLFLECDYDDEENVLVFRRRPRGSGEATFLGITASSAGGFEFDTGADALSTRKKKELAAEEMPHCEGKTGTPVNPLTRIVCGDTQSAVFSIGYSKSREDLLYFLEKKRDMIALKSIGNMMRSAAGTGEISDSAERFLLRSIYFPQPEENTESGALVFRQSLKSDFYKFSISGDLPMIAVRLFRTGGRQSENLKAMLGMFRYACIRGIRFDLIVLYRESDEYGKSTLSHIKRLVSDMGCENFLSVDGGIFAIDTEKLSGAEMFALLRSCGATVDASAPLSVTLFSNKYFTPLSKDAERSLCDKVCDTVFPCERPPLKNEIKNVYGGTFYDDGFLCDKEEIARPWAHIVSTHSAGFVATQNSLGFTFGTNSSQLKLTPHDGRAMTEDSGEKLIMQVTGEGNTSARFDLCACSAYADYFFGGVRYTGKVCGISYEVEVTLDEKLAMKYTALKLSSEKEKDVRITYSAVPCLGAFPTDARGYLFSCDTAKNAVRIRRICGEKIVPKMEIITNSEESKVYTDTAAAMTDGAIYGGTADCAAICVSLKIKKSASCDFALFAYRTDADREYCDKAFSTGARERACRNIKPPVAVKTSDPLFDLTVNRWFNYQCIVSRITARTGFYQNGGAYGFRDQLQDCLSVGGDLLKKQILFCACHQYEEGDVMHWWHNLYEGGGGHYGIRTRCSDDCAWLLYAAEEYILRSDDKTILDMPLPFISSAPLDARELERYEFGRFTKKKYTLFEHLLRAAERLCRTGSHGLALFGTCDWNDGMNEVGKGGKGESVWLSQFASARLSAFAVICAERGENTVAQRFETVASGMRNAVEAYCFEGDRYIRGFYDDGSPLGSKTCDECRIDILPQAFSVLCLAGKPLKQAKTAMATAIKELYDGDLGIIKLLSPPFDKTSRSPGYIKGYPPGIRENGGQYTHAAVWGAMATAEIGDGGLAFRMLCDINPAVGSENALIRYGAEPYVLCGDVGSVGRNAGRGGWSWYTGAAGWYRTAVISSLCGYKESGGGFYFSPALSDDFCGYSLEIIKGGSIYRVCVSCGEENVVCLDGDVISEGKPVFETLFYPDGKEHVIKIEVKK